MITQYKSLAGINLKKFPCTQKIAECQIDLWPGHEKTIATSLGNRDEKILFDTEITANLIKKLTDNFKSLKKICKSYQYLCEELVLQSEIYFRRYGKYERSKFRDAYRDIYSNKNLMKKYMNGLLLTGVFWNNHASAISYYKRKYLNDLALKCTDHLEIGPGHGNLLYLASKFGTFNNISAWDISKSSISLTKKALKFSGIKYDKIKISIQDIMKVNNNEKKFDSIVISEILEHLEDPLEALKSLYKITKLNGLVFINVPSNSPAPDHLFLIDHPSELNNLVKKSGYNIKETIHFPMTGYTLDQCLKDKLTITCVIIAVKN